MPRPFRCRPRFPLWLLPCLSAVTHVMAQPGRGPTPVLVTSVLEREAPPSIRLVGTILAERTSTVASEVAGIVAKLDVREGQLLQFGDVICALESEPAQYAMAEAQGTLQQFQERLAELKNGTREEVLRRLDAAVAESKALFDKWAFEKQRVSKLFELGQSNPKERHDTEMEYLAAERRLSQSTAALEEARNGPRREEIAAAAFAVAAQEARARVARWNLDHTQIRAPFAGYITARHTEVGAWLDTGGAVCDLVALSVVRARVDVPESAIRFAHPGAPVSIEVEALGTALTAQVTRVVPQANAAARSFPIEIELSNPDHKLLPGMFVWAHVPSGATGKRLMVSKDAIVADGLSKKIFVVRTVPDQPAMALPMQVTCGMESDGLIEVTAPGLAAGDLVVARANERLFGPTPVIPTPLESAGSAASRPSSSATGAAETEPGATRNVGPSGSR